MKLIRNSETSHMFWGEIAPSDHLVQIYDTDTVFIDALEGYVAGGLRSGDSVILIGTAAHMDELESRLLARGLDIAQARADDKYIRLDAEQTLAGFMVDGWPDEDRFQKIVGGLLERAGRDGAHVRAFGEMVAVLWAKRLFAATVRLEHLWHRFCSEGGFSLLCAYPHSGVTNKAGHSMKQICDAHTHVITSFGTLPN